MLNGIKGRMRPSDKFTIFIRNFPLLYEYEREKEKDEVAAFLHFTDETLFYILQ